MRWLIAATLLLSASVAAQQRPTTELEPEVDASEMVLPSLLGGPGYQVEPRAQVHGYLAHFRVHSDWGSFDAEGVEMLALRIAEMPAVEALHGESLSRALGQSSLEAARTPLLALGHVVRHPVRSAVGLPRGLWRHFSERARRYADRARRLGARADQRISHDGSPFEDPDAPLSAARRPHEESEDSGFGDVGDELLRLAKGELGYRSARRALAARLGVDPYSGNPLLRAPLDRLAWSATAGRFGVERLLGLLDPGVSDALDVSGDVNRLVLQLPPEDLGKRNDEALAQHCGDASLRYQFLSFGRFSPTLATQFVDQLSVLEPAAGCEALLETALMAHSEVEARFLLNSLRLIAHYLGSRSSAGEFHATGALLWFRSADDELLLPLPVDLLSWTADTARWFDHGIDGAPMHRTVLVSGRITPLAQRELTARGWSLVSELPYPGSPPYAAGVIARPLR